MERDSQPARGSWSDTPETRLHGGDSTAGVIAAMESCLNERGPRSALEFLNARTRYRFTGVYHADPPLLRNLFLFDRENPALTLSAGAVTPLDETWCGIVVSSGEEFATDDAALDAKLREHAARESVISYAGVPLRLASGRTWGTLCHFDNRPRLLFAPEFAVLHAAAPILMRWLREHERPARTPDA